MGRSRTKQTYTEADPEINLTPLIDVVFVVLILFIVVAPLLDRDQVALAPSRLARQTVAERMHDYPLTIHVKSDHSIWVQGEPISPEQLQGSLLQRHVAHPESTPQLFCDKTAPFGTYQQVKNACEEAGYEQLDVILEP